MTEYAFIEGRILHHRKRLERAEAAYRHAVTHGTQDDMRAALTDCQAIRAKLIMYLRRRDELTGGVRYAENHR